MITITNLNAAATTLLVDGVNRSISGSGSIQIDDGALTRLLAAPTYQRFLPSGDLTHTNPPAGGPPNIESPAFSATVDLSATVTTPIVPAAPGRSFVLRSWRLAFTGGAGAALLIQEAGAQVEGVDINSITSPLILPSFHWATQPGHGLDLAVSVGGAAGSATVDIWGAYI